MERQGGLPPARRGPATLAHALWHTSGSRPASGASRGERPGRTLLDAATPLRPAARLAACAPRSSVRLYRCAVRAMRGLGFVRTAAPAATVTPAATHACPSPAAPTACAAVAAATATAAAAAAAAAAVTDATAATAAAAAAHAADAAAAPTAPTAAAASTASAAAIKALGRVDEGEAARRSRRVALELSRPARHNARKALRNSAAHHLPHTAG